MFKFFKIIAALITTITVTVIIINLIDVKPSENLKKLQKLHADHKLTPQLVSTKKFVNSVINLDQMDTLRKDSSSSILSCFTKSTCSDYNYNLALQEAPLLLKKHNATLVNFHKALSNYKAVTLSPEATISENLSFSLDTLIRLHLIEINYLYSKTNSDKAQADRANKKALVLDRFIRDTLYQPNFNITLNHLTLRLEWLRSSIQKYSPRKIDLPEVDSSRIIKNIRLGEFIIFSNLLNSLLKKQNHEQSVFFKKGSLPTAFISKNRTLNLYADLSEKYSKAECVTAEDQQFCKEIRIKHLHPVNPAGKTLVKTVVTSPTNYKRVTSIVKKINALNL